MQWSNDNNDEGTPIKWCNQHMNSAIVVAYNNNNNKDGDDDDYVYSIGSNMIAVLYYTIIM